MEEISEHLPIWIQITLATAAFLGTAFAAFQGYTKKHLHEESAAVKPAGDTVVISAALADAGAVRELTSAIRLLHSCTERLIEVTETGNVKTDRLVSSSEAVERELRSLAERVDARINGSRTHG